MTKEQREAYRPVLEAWLDGELEFAKDGKNFERWDSEWPPTCNSPPDHYRRRPKPRVGYIVIHRPDNMHRSAKDAREYDPNGFVFRCEEVIE